MLWRQFSINYNIQIIRTMSLCHNNHIPLQYLILPTWKDLKEDGIQLRVFCFFNELLSKWQITVLHLCHVKRVFCYQSKTPSEDNSQWCSKDIFPLLKLKDKRGLCKAESQSNKNITVISPLITDRSATTLFLSIEKLRKQSLEGKEFYPNQSLCYT